MASHPQTPHRILSIDGGGIYGLVSALWLKELCERDPGFLAGDDVDLFAGISAGALNALLLAKHARPRDAVLSGELLAFWTDRVGVFSNTNPATAWLSLFGVGGWVAAPDFLHQLERYFGDRTLEDLPHKVLISAFNWHGDQAIDFDGARHARRTRFPTPWGVSELVRDAILDAMADQAADTAQSNEARARRAWRPKLFTNLADDEDRKYRVADVAYGAATPAGTRAIRGGIGDAATYAANPSVQAIAGLVHTLHLEERDAPEHELSAGHFLDQIALLSIGNGSTPPHYWLKDFDFSLLQMAVIPTNPIMGVFYPPHIDVQFDGTIEDANYIAHMLLTRRARSEGGAPPRFVSRYHRLGPPIMRVPVAVASLLSRFPVYRALITQQIHEAVRSPRSLGALETAARFLAAGWSAEARSDGRPFSTSSGD